MSTNPNNAVGTNGAYDGRTSVNAFNDVLGVFTGRGVLSGWALQPSAGMVITVGGSGSTRDVAVAEDNIGNKTTINNISEAPISVTIPAAPATNSRIDLVVAYVDNPPQGASTDTDNYGACGLIVVSGTAAQTPNAPSDGDIRTAITADGGAGSVAYYVVLGSVLVSMGTTDIDATMITNGTKASIASKNLQFTTYSGTSAINFSAGVVNQTTRSAAVKGGTATIAATFQVGTAFAENASFAVVPAYLRPLVRTYFILNSGKLGYIEPNGNCYALGGLTVGWWSLSMTVLVN